MRTLVLLMAALFLAAGLASAPAQAIGVQKEMKVGFIYFPDRRGRVVIRA